jgi:type II secretory pathway pseudopilin PulG
MTPNPPPPPQQAKTSGLAIAALVLGIIGCIPALGLVGLVLGIVALATIPSNGTVKGRGLAIAGIVLPVFWFLVIGIVAAIALPRIAREEAIAKQKACELGLHSVYQAEIQHFVDTTEYSNDFGELSLAAPPGVHCAYFLSREGPGSGDASIPASVIPRELAGGVDVGVSGESFTIVAVAQLDGDPDFDVWSLSSEDRYDERKHQSVPAGTAYHEVDDL